MADPADDFMARLDAELRALRDDVDHARDSLELALPPPPPPRPEPAPFPPLPALTVELPEPAPRRRRRRLPTILLTVIGALVLVVLLAISIGPLVLPYETYVVRSGSMEPTIATGALVIATETDSADLREGDIITFERPDHGGLITHRIVGIETRDSGTVFITRGDANARPDPWRVPADGTGLRHRFDVPVAGYVFGVLGTPVARVLLIVVPIVVLLVLSRRDRTRRRR